MILRNTDIATLLDRVGSGGAKLICFGAGEQLRDACAFFSEFGFFGRIAAILDNRAKTFAFNGAGKPCLPVSEVRNIKGGKILYLSSKYYPEMWEQLSACAALASCDCYVHQFVMHAPLKYEFPRQQAGAAPRIPKTIHFCWFGGGEIPAQNRKWMESWRKHCPDYEIVRHDETNYDVTKNRYMHEAYGAKKWAFVSDYARLDIIHESGGVYLDTDVELFRGLGELLHDDAFIGLSSLFEANNGLGFGAVPGFPLIKEMRDHYDQFPFVKSDGELNLIDNSKYQTAILRKHGFADVNKLQMAGGMRIYPTDVLSPMNYMGYRLAFTANTVAMHHYEASWLDEKSKARQAAILREYEEFMLSHPLARE